MLQPVAPDAPVRYLRTKRLAMAAATAFLAMNLWTGAPLFALWVGSRAVGQRTLSMGAVAVVVVVLAALVVAMLFALVWLDATYRRLTGHPLRENRLTWLRSMNTQGQTLSEGPSMDLLEAIVVATVCLAVLALVVWFFLFAGSPLPHG